jgi:Bacterial mobilisation protein (MobC)
MEPAHPKGGSRRSPGEYQRAKTMTVRFTDGELTAVRAAAERAGMAASAWVGELAVDAAEHRAMPPGWLHREVMAELVHLRSQITWVGNNVNQIACAINSGIVPDVDMRPVFARLTEVAESIEQQPPLRKRLRSLLESPSPVSPESFSALRRPARRQLQRTRRAQVEVAAGVLLAIRAPDLPAGGHEEDRTVITERDRIR